MASKILIVDDDASSLNLLRMHLERDGYAVFTAGSGTEGLRLAYEHKPDAVILDVRMPGMDGHEVCGRLRDISDAAILFVTVLKAPQDIVRGLELGADDYIIKPFNYDELSARLQACLRRRAAQRRRAVAAGTPPSPWSLDAGRREVVQGNKRVQLTPKEFEVLQFFLDHPDKVLAADDILAQLWGPEYVGDPDLVKQFVYRLRAKLEDNPSEPRYFVTVRGSGYAFEADTKPSISRPSYDMQSSGTGDRAGLPEQLEEAAAYPSLGSRSPSEKSVLSKRPVASGDGQTSPMVEAVPRAQLRSGLRRRANAGPNRTARRYWTVRLGALLIALVTIVGGTAVAQASGDALPGDWLYPVKQGVEFARLQAAGGMKAKAELRLALAAERAEEVEALLAAGLGKEVPTAAARLVREIRELTGILKDQSIEDAAGAHVIAGQLEQVLKRHAIELTALEQVVSPELGPSIRYAKDISAQAWAEARLALEGSLQAVMDGQPPAAAVDFVPAENALPTAPSAGAKVTPESTAEAGEIQPTDAGEGRQGGPPTAEAIVVGAPTAGPSDDSRPPGPTGLPSPATTPTPTSSSER